MATDWCFESHDGDRYIFYSDIDKYEQYQKVCTNPNEFNKYEINCNFVNSPYEEKLDELTGICKIYKCLIHNILKNDSLKNINNKFHSGYLNYWLNYQLHTQKTNTCAQNFFKHLRFADSTNDALLILRNNVKFIEEDEVKDMNLLFTLYTYYNEIDKTIKDLQPTEEYVMRYVRKCVEKYRILEDKCIEKHTDFCNALRIFKSKYEKIDLKNHNIEEWTKKELPLLSKYERVQTKAIVPLVSVSSSLSQDTKISEQIIDYTGTRVVDLGTTYESTEASEKGSVPSAPVNLHTTNEISGLMIDQQKMPLEEGKQIETKSEDGFDTHTNKIIGTSISTVGVSSLFFLFYKFTSLGSRFRSQNKNKKYIRNNFDQQSNNFLDTSEHQYLPEESMSYNISYNSV